MIHLSRILAALRGDCLTTSLLARRLGEPEDAVREACVRAAYDGRLRLVSWGWDWSLAWCEPDADMLPADREDPWYMSPSDRWGVLSEV